MAGPSGYTIREVIKETGADVKSWTDKVEDDLTRPTRTFIIEVGSHLKPMFAVYSSSEPASEQFHILLLKRCSSLWLPFFLPADSDTLYSGTS